MDFVKKVKGFFLEPSKTFDASKEDTLIEAIKYFTINAAIFSAIFAIIYAFFPGLGPILGLGSESMPETSPGIAVMILIFVIMMVFAILWVLIFGTITHIGVYIMGGRKGIIQTLKAVMYASTISLLLGWIPIINIIAWIWALVVEILGIRQLHNLTTGKATLALILPFIMLLIVLVIIHYTINNVTM